MTRSAGRVIQNPDQIIRYLLTIHKNSGDEYAAGGALFELGLTSNT